MVPMHLLCCKRMYRHISGLVINVTGMATPIAGAIVLLGFNDPIKSVITIITASITSILLSLVIGK